MSEKMSKEKAYEILGLNDGATVEEVKRKYENLMRRQKYDKSFDVDEVTKAFDTIMGYDWGNFEKDEAYTKKGINKKKIDNFFYHYKRSLIYGLIVFIAVGTLLISVLGGNKKVDFGVAFVGDLIITDMAGMEEYIANKHQFESVMANYVSYSNDGDSGANIYRLLLIIDEPKYNILYTNKEATEFLIEDGSLIDLTDYLDIIGISEEDERIIWHEDYEGKVIPGAIYSGRDTEFQNYIQGFIPEYIGIPDRSNNKEKSSEFIKLVLENK